MEKTNYSGHRNLEELNPKTEKKQRHYKNIYKLKI